MGNQCCSNQANLIGFTQSKRVHRTVRQLKQPAKTFVTPSPLPVNTVSPIPYDANMTMSPGKYTMKNQNKEFLQKYQYLRQKIFETIVQYKSILTIKKWQQAFQSLNGIYLTVTDRVDLIKNMYYLIKVELKKQFDQKEKDQNLILDEINEFQFSQQTSKNLNKFYNRVNHRKNQTKNSLALIRQFDTYKLDFTDVNKLANKVNDLCKKDINAFGFLTLYLMASINQQLNQDPSKLFDIMQKLKSIFNQLSVIYPPSTVQKQQQIQQPKQLDSSIQYDTCIKYPMIKFTTKNIDLMFDQLQKQIQKKAKLAKKNKQYFDQILKPICLNRAKYYQSALKVKSMQVDDLCSLFRVIEKVLFQDQTDQFKKWMEQNKQQIIEYIREQPQTNKVLVFNQKYGQVLDTIEKTLLKDKNQLPFCIGDLLRGKAMFRSRSDISKTVKQIYEQFQKLPKNQYAILQTDDRLQKPTKDFKIQFLINETIAQLQLAKQTNHFANEFNHKIYELKRTKGFTPIWNVYMINERLCEIYFSDQLQLIEYMIESEDLEFTMGKEDLRVFEEKYLQKNVTAYKQDDDYNFDRVFTEDRATNIKEIQRKMKEIQEMLRDGYEYNENYQRDKVREENSKSFMK